MHNCSFRNSCFRTAIYLTHILARKKAILAAKIGIAFSVVEFGQRPQEVSQGALDVVFQLSTRAKYATVKFTNFRVENNSPSAVPTLPARIELLATN